MDKTAKCPCGRSPTGICIGWHRLTEDKYQVKLKEYEQLDEDKKKNAFHLKAIDGFGE